MRTQLEQQREILIVLLRYLMIIVRATVQRLIGGGLEGLLQIHVATLGGHCIARVTGRRRPVLL